MRPWAPDLRRSERGPTESDGSARPDATPGWLLAAHSAVCSRNASPIHHGDMGDSQMAPCTTVPSKAPRIPMVTFPWSQTHTCQMHLCYIMSPHYVVQEGISGDSSLAEICLREVRLRHQQMWQKKGLGKDLGEPRMSHAPPTCPVPRQSLLSMLYPKGSLCILSKAVTRATNSRRSGELIRLELCTGQWEASLGHEVGQVSLGAGQTQGMELGWPEQGIEPGST